MMWMPGRKCGGAYTLTLAFPSPVRLGSQDEIKGAALLAECSRDLGGFPTLAGLRYPE